MVYIASSAAGDAFTASDFNAAGGKGVVLVSGGAALASIREQIAHVAAQVCGWLSCAVDL
jgi:hypothetical protein